MITVIAFIATSRFSVILIFPIIHFIGMYLCARDPYLFNIS